MLALNCMPPFLPLLQPHRTALALVPRAVASSSEAAAPRKQTGPKPSPVPDVDAEQLLQRVRLSDKTEPAALLRNLGKLPDVRQQGVLDHAAAVAAHLLSPAVGLTEQQAGQLLECCPELFSWPPEQRAAVLFGQLLGAGLTAAGAAQCLAAYPAAADRTTLAPGLAELAAILAHSQDRDSSLGGPVPKVPAAQRTVAALLTQTPSAAQLVCQRAGYLRQQATELQLVGYTAAQVAELAWGLPELLWADVAANLASVAAVPQQELGLAAAQVVSLAAKRRLGWISCSPDTLRERAAALAEVSGAAMLAHALCVSSEVCRCFSTLSMS